MLITLFKDTDHHTLDNTFVENGTHVQRKTTTTTTAKTTKQVQNLHTVRRSTWPPLSRVYAFGAASRTTWPKQQQWYYDDWNDKTRPLFVFTKGARSFEGHSTNRCVCVSFSVLLVFISVLCAVYLRFRPVLAGTGWLRRVLFHNIEGMEYFWTTNSIKILCALWEQLLIANCPEVARAVIEPVIYFSILNS